MTTMVTETVRITIDAPFERITSDLADPMNHPEWATEFFSGPARADGNQVLAKVPRMGGDAHIKVDGDPATGQIDLYLAPVGAPFGPPLPVRVLPNGDGADVLFTLSRAANLTDAEWEAGLASMRRELENLKRRHELS